MDSQASPTYAFISTTSTTYHPENPLENAIIDNPALVRRRRRKTSARELEVLEMAFKECEKPSKEARDEIARKTGMDGKAVQIWFQNKRQSTRRLPKPSLSAIGAIDAPAALVSRPLQVLQPTHVHNPNIPLPSNVPRIPLSLKANHPPLSPMTRNIQKPSLETTCLSSSAPKRAPLKRTPSIRLTEGIGGKATVVFEETEVATANAENLPPKPKKRRIVVTKGGKKVVKRTNDPGKENIPPMSMGNKGREPQSADLEEIALGLIALGDAR